MHRSALHESNVLHQYTAISRADMSNALLHYTSTVDVSNALRNLEHNKQCDTSSIHRSIADVNDALLYYTDLQWKLA